MEPDNIDDVRTEFKNITFSNFQKSKARQELINCIYNCKIENANYWSAEFICAGHFLDLWDIIILYATKYIHCGKPKLPIYLNMRYDNFSNIINSGYSTNIIVLRNNTKIRKLFSEIICILCYSNKKHNYQQVKLNKTQEFDLTNISSKFKAPSVNFVENILILGIISVNQCVKLSFAAPPDNKLKIFFSIFILIFGVPLIKVSFFEIGPFILFIWSNL